jgi:hypothetical protein
MAEISVKVSIPELGNADFRRTAKELDAWELVKITAKAGDKIDLKIGQNSGCSHVTTCGVSVTVGVEFSVAKDINDAIAGAVEKQVSNAWRQLRLRIVHHAREHFNRVVKDVIPPWQKNFQKDLEATLPTERKPTSLAELEIHKQVGTLVAYWIAELGFRMEKDINDWERQDYPELTKFLRDLKGIEWFLPNGFPVPQFRKSAPPRPKIAFPACVPKKAPAKGSRTS